MGLKKKIRLKSKKRIEELFHNGKRSFHYPLQVLYAPSPVDHHRIAIAVGKKKIKSAHQRNTIKRRIREQCRKTIKNFTSENAMDMVIVYHGRKIHNSSEISRALSLFLTKVGILKS